MKVRFEKTHGINLICAVVLLTLTILAAPMGADFDTQAKIATDAHRPDTIKATLVASNVFDCATYQTEASVIEPPEETFLFVRNNQAILPDDDKEYLGAVWSHIGDKAVFTLSTNQVRLIPGVDQADESGSIPTAIVQSELYLFKLPEATWQQITTDGVRPAWSKDDMTIYYMQGVDMLATRIDTLETTKTGLSSNNDVWGLVQSKPLDNGALLSTGDQAGTMKVKGNEVDVQKDIFPGPIVLMPSDEVFISPAGDRMVVANGSIEKEDVFIEGIASVYGPGETITPILKNCQASVTNLAWSPDGANLAFPVDANLRELRILNLETRETRVVIRSNDTDKLSGLSWSPDGKYIAYTKGDGREHPRSIWVVATDGSKRQYLTDGLLPHWSPDGNHILYSRPDEKRFLDWYLAEVSIK